MKILKKVLFLISIIFIYLVFKELIQLLYFSFNLNPIFGYLVVLCILAITVYFIIIPIIRILRIPRVRGPVRQKSQEEELIKVRMNHFKNNELLQNELVDSTNITFDIKDYDEVVEILKKKCFLIRKRYVSSLFYSTALFQNGFLDSIAILSASVGLVKDTFLLYNGRVSNKDLLIIAKKVYYSIAIGGSEAVEMATGEVITSFVKGTPILEKISTSFADGFVNAILLTRISLITENYCTRTYIEKEKDLYPSPTTIIKAASMITSDMISRIKTDFVVRGFEKVVLSSKTITDHTIEKVKSGGGIIKDKTTNYIKSGAKATIKPVKSLFKSNKKDKE